MTGRVLTMPRLGETMEEGTIVSWVVKPGEAFQRGAPLVEIETDKTVVEYPALGAGTLEEVLAAEGDRISVGAPIARVTVEGAGDWVDGGAEDAAPPPEAETAPSAEAPLHTPAPVTKHARRRATPPARRMARQAGLDLDQVPGTGRRGRIERRDVESVLGAPGRYGAAVGADGIAYETVGEGATTFLLIHGFAGDRSAWAATASALVRGGHRVVVPDLPAHGETRAEAETLEDLVDAMSGFAEGLDGPVHLVGHSLGAAVAVGVAGRLGKTAASLTLIAPAGAGREINGDFVHGMAEARTAGELAHLLRLLGPKGGELSDAMLEAMAGQLARGRLKPLAQALAGPHGQRVDILRPLDALPAALPVRALIGTQDRIIPAHHAFNLPARVAVHFLAAGHMPQWDAPRETLALLNGATDE